MQTQLSIVGHSPQLSQNEVGAFDYESASLTQARRSPLAFQKSVTSLPWGGLSRRARFDRPKRTVYNTERGTQHGKTAFT
jgi:hypothetical protein